MNLSDTQRAALARQAQRGGIIRDWMRAPAADILKQEMEAAAGRDMLRWLSATPEEAEKMRLAAQPYAKFFEVVKSLILSGDNAQRALDASTAQSEESPA